MPRVYQRRFDRDEARRLRDQGLTYAEVGRRLGVTREAIRYGLDPAARLRADAARARLQTSGTCIDCGAPCSHNATSNTLAGRGPDDDVCRECSYARQRTSVRPDALWCPGCEAWLPDDAFHRNASSRKGRRGRRNECKACDTARRHAYRVLHPDKERAAQERRQQRRRAA